MRVFWLALCTSTLISLVNINADYAPPSSSHPPVCLVCLNLSVRVQNSEKGSKGDFIAKIEKIYTDKNSEVQLDVKWYYRPEETAMGRMPWHARLEVLASDHTDSIHVGSVNSKCEIYDLEQVRTQRDKPPQTFFLIVFFG